MTAGTFYKKLNYNDSMGHKHTVEHSSTVEHGPYKPEDVGSTPTAPKSTPTSAPLPAPVGLQAPAPAPAGGNGMIWCSGPQAPGWNVSTHACQPFSTTTNAITPHQPQTLKLTQLPYTGYGWNELAIDTTFNGTLLIISIVLAYIVGRLLNKRII